MVLCNSFDIPGHNELCCPGSALLRIVFSERLDFERDFGDKAMLALQWALVNPQVSMCVYATL
jgi:hypothetical protein